MKTSTETLIKALRILAEDIKSDDGVANAAIAEAADRLEELELNLVTIGELAIANWDYDTVEKVDNIVKDPMRYKDMLDVLFRKNYNKIKELENIIKNYER